MLLNGISCIGLITFSKIAGYILYNNDFFIAWKYSIILLMAYFFNSLASFFGTVYTTAKKTNMLMITSIYGASINIVLNFIFIPNFGATAASIATLIGYVVVFIIRLWDTRKLMRLDVGYRDIIVLIISMILCSIFMILDLEYSFVCSAIILVLIIAYSFGSLKPKKSNEEEL